MDGGVLAFGVAIALVSGVLVGALPFPSAVRSLGNALRDGGDRSLGSRGARRIERGLVVLQLAACVVLLTAAGLAGRSLARLASVDAGFDARGVVTVRLSAARERYTSNARVVQFDRALHERLSSIAGATHVALSGSYPLAPGTPMAMPMRLEGGDGRSASPLVNVQQVSTGYFRAIGTPLVRGRDFEDSDTPTAHAGRDRQVDGATPLGGEDPSDIASRSTAARAGSRSSASRVTCGSTDSRVIRATRSTRRSRRRHRSACARSRRARTR